MSEGYAKGQRYMRDVAALLTVWTGWPFQLRPTLVEPLDGWDVKGDLTCPSAARFPFVVECKKIEGWEWDGLFEAPRWPVWGWWEQCKRQADSLERGRPLLIFTRNHRKNYALAREDDLRWLRLTPNKGPLVLVERRGERVGFVLLEDILSCRNPSASSQGRKSGRS